MWAGCVDSGAGINHPKSLRSRMSPRQSPMSKRWRYHTVDCPCSVPPRTMENALVIHRHSFPSEENQNQIRQEHHCQIGSVTPNCSYYNQEPTHHYHRYHAKSYQWSHSSALFMACNNSISNYYPTASRVRNRIVNSLTRILLFTF